RNRLATEPEATHKAAIKTGLDSLKQSLTKSKSAGDDATKIVQWLTFVADLADPDLIEQVTDYLLPQHPVPAVRVAALEALAHMGGPKALDAVKLFISENAPAGETLSVARRIRLS